MDPDEEASTAASSDHIIKRLQSLEAADQLRSVSVLPVVVNVRSGVVHRVVGDPSNQPSDMADSLRFPLRESAMCSLR